MLNRDIITTVIKKAESNKFKYGYDWKGRDEAIFWLDSYHSLIFDHDFAKAFFGEQEHDYVDDGSSIESCKYCSAYIEEYTETVGDYCWQQHLSDMVLLQEPLKYLEKYL